MLASQIERTETIERGNGIVCKNNIQGFPLDNVEKVFTCIDADQLTIDALAGKHFPVQVGVMQVIFKIQD